MSDGGVVGGRGLEVGDYEGFEEVFVFDEVAEHQFAEGGRAGGLDVWGGGCFEGFGEDLEDGFLMGSCCCCCDGWVVGGRGGRRRREKRGVGGEDVGQDVD